MRKESKLPNMFSMKTVAFGLYSIQKLERNFLNLELKNGTKHFSIFHNRLETQPFFSRHSLSHGPPKIKNRV